MYGYMSPTALLHICCVIQDKGIHCSGPRFPHLVVRSIYYLIVPRIKWHCE